MINWRGLQTRHIQYYWFVSMHDHSDANVDEPQSNEVMFLRFLIHTGISVTMVTVTIYMDKVISLQRN